MKHYVMYAILLMPTILFSQIHNRIIFLHHSTGGNVYNYPDEGVPAWFSDYNATHGTNFQISDRWYPSDNNMPVDYYQEWIEGTGLDTLVSNYDVIIWKHCYPASDVFENTGNPDPSSTYQSIENYKAIYRLIRSKMDSFPDRIFIVWTIPPRHRLYGPSNGDTLGNAMRAREFTAWVKDTFLHEDGEHRNMYVFDFRGIVADSGGLFLRYEYERSHTGTDSHPNDAANNVAGPLFAQFIVDAVNDFESSKIEESFHLQHNKFYLNAIPALAEHERIAIYNVNGKRVLKARGSDILYVFKMLPTGIYLYRKTGADRESGMILKTK